MDHQTAIHELSHAAAIAFLSPGSGDEILFKTDEDFYWVTSPLAEYRADTVREAFVIVASGAIGEHAHKLYSDGTVTSVSQLRAHFCAQVSAGFGSLLLHSTISKDGGDYDAATRILREYPDLLTQLVESTFLSAIWHLLEAGEDRIQSVAQIAFDRGRLSVAELSDLLTRQVH